MPAGPITTRRRAGTADRKASRLDELNDPAPERPAATGRFGDIRWFELKGNLPLSGSVTEGQSAEAYDLTWDGSVLAVDTDSTFTVYDPFGAYRGRKKDKYSSPHDQGSRGYTQWMPLTLRWEIMWMQPHATLIKGLLTGAVVAGTGTFTIDGVTVLGPPGALITDSDPAAAITVRNRGFEGDDNAIALVLWDESATERLVFDIPCPIA